MRGAPAEGGRPSALPHKLRLSQRTSSGRGQGPPTPDLDWDPGVLWGRGKGAVGASCPRCPSGAGRKETLTMPKFGASLHISRVSEMSGGERRREVEEWCKTGARGHVTTRRRVSLDGAEGRCGGPSGPRVRAEGSGSSGDSGTALPPGPRPAVHRGLWARNTLVL